MKPRKLKIMGLNSFVEEQEIDFTQLTEKGFFGIFGPTGSGKSSILDAMTIALYGEISRSNKRLEFINSFRNDMNIYYEFEIGSIKNRYIYSVERHYKRKKDGGISCDRAILTCIKEDGFEILSEGANSVTESIVGIIGLKCDDFTRSVVLPQGKFSDFLKLTKGDRGKMLERIFNLEEFGSKMAFKIKGELNKKRSELDLVNGALSRYEGLTEELYEQKKEELKLLINEENRLKLEKEIIEVKYEKYNTIFQLTKELELFEGRHRELLNSENMIKTKSEVVSKAKRALNVKPFIDVVKETKGKIDAGGKKLIDINNRFSVSVKNLSNTEKEYEEAYYKKDKLLPELIEKESKLNEAIKLDEEINRLDKEINEKRREYQELKVKATDIENELKNIQEEKDGALKSIEDIEDRICKLKVASEHRERVIEALDIEKEFKESNEKIKEISLKLNELSHHLDLKRTEKEKISGIKNKVAEKLSKLCEKQMLLLENSPGDAAALYKEQSLLQEMNSVFNDAKKNNDKAVIITEELKSVETNIKNTSEKLKGIQYETASLKKEAEALNNYILEEEKRNIMGQVAESIKEGEACPLCGSLHHPNLAEKHQDVDLEKKKNELISINKKLEKLIENENLYKIELGGCEKEYKLKEAILEELKNKLSGICIEDYEKNINQMGLKLETLKINIEKHMKETQLVEEEIKELIEDKNKTELRYAEVSMEIGKDEALFSSMGKDEEKLRERHNILMNNYENIKRELKVDSIQSEYERVKRNSLAEEEARRKQNLFRQRIIELDGLRNVVEVKKTEVYNGMENLSVSGKERSKSMQDKINKRNEYSENKNPYDYIAEVKHEITSIREIEAALKIKLENERSAKQRLSEEKLNEEKNILTLKEVLVESEGKLRFALVENGFEVVEEVINSTISQEIIGAYEKEIRDFDVNLKSAKDNISRINKKLNGDAIDEISWTAIVENKRDNENQREVITRQIAGHEKNIERMEKDFKEITALSKKKREKEHELSLLFDIQELISGNKFVEFAATNQLKYISLEASRRLRDITRGRYALELDSNNEFVMRDDFNGGIRRSADTLSGGETFLTSLCLALSLSSNIQLKGNSPLEFFFLDEGFGTLDIDLLEVVITSLERLRSDKLCVGIISHVEELKSRVPIKLLVSPGNIEGNGTRVLIEHS